MATIPKDIQDGLKKLAEATGTPIQSLIKRLGEIKSTDEAIQAMEKEDFKIRYAWAALYKENSSSGGAEDFYILPTICPTPREITTKKGELMYIGELSALVQKLEKDDNNELQPGDVQFAAGTFFRDGAKHLVDLQKGKVYKAGLIAKENKWGLEISSDRATFAPVDYKFPVTFEKYYDEEIAPKNIDITLGEMDLNVGETPTDIRVFTVTAFDCDVGENEGREYGWYDFMDDSIMGSNVRMFFHPKDVEYAQGSILKVGVKITINPKTDEPMVSPYFIIPTEVAEKRTFTVKPVGQKPEEVDISLDSRTAKAKEILEEKPELSPEETKEEAPKQEPKAEEKPVESSKKEESKEQAQGEVSFEI